MIKMLKKEIIEEVTKSGIDIDGLIEGTYKEPVIEVYNCHEWDHGYYGGSGYNGTRREFYEDLREMTAFLYKYMNECNIKEVIIAPLHRGEIFAWKGDMKKDEGYSDIYIEVMEFLKKNNIGKYTQSGVKIAIDSNMKIIEMILEGAYRHVITLCLFFPEKAVMIEPTHHFNLEFFMKNFEREKKIITNLIKNHQNLRYYESLPPFEMY